MPATDSRRQPGTSMPAFSKPPKEYPLPTYLTRRRKMHPTFNRILHAWTKREEERIGATALEAEADLKAALIEIRSIALFPTIRSHAHNSKHPYAEALTQAANYIRRHKVPPRWSIK